MTPDSIGALRAVHDRLHAVATPLTAAQVRGRGYPAEWSIAQVLSHIGSGAEINLLILDAGLAGADTLRETNEQVWDRWNARSADEQATDGVAADAALVEKVEAHAGTDKTFQVWGGPVDIAGFARSRLGEQTVHTWDVEVAVDPTATLVPEAVPLLLETLSALAGFATRPADWTGVVHVTTSAPAAAYALTIGERSSVAAWEPGASADATLEIPAEALIRLIYGRLDPAHTPDGVRADGVDLDDLRAAYPGF